MAEMTSLYSLFALIPLVISGFILYAHQRTHGSLNDITTESVAFDCSKYGSLVDWDKYSLKIEGEFIPILSGEFHYWRVPDRERWKTILQQYRTAGFNTIRIYFHWGYHSPSEGVYLFDGNCDIDYLLTLCEQLGLFVLAAPGPYICAETQAGGYPSWLVAKRHLRIRHNTIMLWRTYDAEFASYEIQWFSHVLPILAKHQITENNVHKRGCVLALQIDNELFETLATILPIGLRDQMRILSKAARDANITVPLFTNDGFEEGGWVPGKTPSFWSKHPFGIDLYGFDKYVVFAPSSSPKSWLIDGDNESGEWRDWNPKQMENSMDVLEKKVRGFGGGAKHSPIFIPELQGGWFNHYQLQHTYDQIYDFYGDHYTKLIVDSSLAQGVTMVSIYMIYGGTNWGTLGDPDVYSSYDYSACIREYGYLSIRGRSVRETMIFAQSFETYFTKTELGKKSSVTSKVSNIVNRQRLSVGSDQQVMFTFYRNFDRKKRSEFEVEVKQYNHRFTMGLHFPYKTSFFGLGNYEAINGILLVQSTLPIHARMVNKKTNEETWIIEPNQIGGLAFEQKSMTITGNMQNDVLRSEGSVSILSFHKNQGWTKISTSSGILYLIGLTRNEVSTLYADFQVNYWNQDNNDRYPGLIAWGADELYYNSNTKSLEIKQNIHDSKIHILSYVSPTDQRVIRDHDEQSPQHLYSMPLEDRSKEQQVVSIDLKKWKSKSVDWKSLHWQPLKRDDKKNIIWDTLDYHFTSGQVIYRNQFKTPFVISSNNSQPKKVTLSLNVRNRATVILNDHIIGGHTTYSRQLFSPGAKIGPDPWFLGTQTYDLTPYLSKEDNTIFIIADSFGLCRQAFIMNDIRNPRGIIKIALNGIENSIAIEQEWQISGVDVRELSQPFGTTGFSDETNESGFSSFTTTMIESNYNDDNDDDASNNSKLKLPIQTFSLNPSQGIQWYQFKFDHTLKQDNIRTIPLRLHINGEFTAKIILNNVFIGLYYGNGDGPQHDFYLPDDLIQRSGNMIKMLVYTWVPTDAQFSIQSWHTQFPGSGNLIQDDSLSTSPERHDYITWKDNVNIG
ncbi:unnamed protein product [Cunninghamella blakesleeana]